jgi:hypothetical protein
MKKFVKVGLALLGVTLVLAFVACENDPEPPKKSGKTSVNGFNVKADGTDYEFTPGDVITKAEWEALTARGDISNTQIGTLNFAGSGVAIGTEAGFSATGVAKGAKVTYAYFINNEKPEPGDFKPLSTRRDLDVGTTSTATVYFKVESENKKNTDYYCFSISGLTQFTDNITISSVRIGNTNAGGLSGSAFTQSVTPDALPTTPTPIDVGSTYVTGKIQMRVIFNNNEQTVTWLLKNENDSGPALTDITGGGFIKVQPNNPSNSEYTVDEISTSGGVTDGQKMYIKVVSGDKTKIGYYALQIRMGNTAAFEDNEGLIIGLDAESPEIKPTTNATWRNATVLDTDIQDVMPQDGFFMQAKAKEDGTVTYVNLGNVTNAALNNTTTYSAANVAALGWAAVPGKLVLAAGDVLAFKIVSQNGKNTVYARVRVIVKNTGIIPYGQPTISGNTIDPLWNEFGNDWPFEIKRINLNEMVPKFRFNHTVKGVRGESDENDNVQEFGHTMGRARVFWDDDGLYVWAEMDYIDFYEDDAAETAKQPTDRETTPVATSDTSSDNHNLDSLEIFVNERLQRYTSGNVGIQYRVNPVVNDAKPAISGDHGFSGDPIGDFRASNLYHAWIRKSGGKEVGYSVIAKVPFKCHDETDANRVFDLDGTVRAEDGDTTGTGPTIGFELQLNATAKTETSRDAIVTWNGITGQSYQNVRNYGNVKLVMNGKTRPPVDRDQVTATSVSVISIPQKAVAPSTGIVAAEQFGGEVTWSPAVTTATGFAYSTEYTATIALTAKRGWTFDGVDANSITVTGAKDGSVSHSAGTGTKLTITAKFDSPATWTAIEQAATLTGATRNATAFAGNYQNFMVPFSLPVGFEISKYLEGTYTVTAKFYGQDGTTEIESAVAFGDIRFMVGSTSNGGDPQYNINEQTIKQPFTDAMKTLFAAGNPTALYVRNAELGTGVRFIEVTGIIFYPE